LRQIPPFFGVPGTLAILDATNNRRKFKSQEVCAKKGRTLELGNILTVDQTGTTKTPQPKEDKNFEREEVKQNRRTTDEESHLRREGGATTIPLRSVCVCLYFC
jgi:hypothetical protein